MSSAVWKKIDASTISAHPHLKETDDCRFAREFIARGSYQSSDTNNLISNFKKSIDCKETAQWYWRNKALGDFAREVSVLFSNKNKAYCMTAIPSSKKRDDPKYDNRFEDFFSSLKTYLPNIAVTWPITAIKTVPPAHHGGYRDPETYKANYQWNGFGGTIPTELFVFDDVLTSGAHFRAFDDFLRLNNFTGNIHGIFWARRIER